MARASHLIINQSIEGSFLPACPAGAEKLGGFAATETSAPADLPAAAMPQALQAGGAAMAGRSVAVRIEFLMHKFPHPATTLKTWEAQDLPRMAGSRGRN